MSADFDDGASETDRQVASGLQPIMQCLGHIGQDEKARRQAKPKFVVNGVLIVDENWRRESVYSSSVFFHPFYLKPLLPFSCPSRVNRARHGQERAEEEPSRRVIRCPCDASPTADSCAFSNRQVLTKFTPPLTFVPGAPALRALSGLVMGCQCPLVVLIVSEGRIALPPLLERKFQFGDQPERRVHPESRCQEQKSADST